jgi:IS5 family transposase
MFKIILLQRWYNLSDEALESALYDRISFARFAPGKDKRKLLSRFWSGGARIAAGLDRGKETRRPFPRFRA